jgi:hypothetical protein
MKLRIDEMLMQCKIRFYPMGVMGGAIIVQVMVIEE